MGRLLVTVVARLVGRDPDDAWEYTVKWVIRFILVIVAITLGFSGAGAVLGTQNGGQPAPVSTTTTSVVVVFGPVTNRVPLFPRTMEGIPVTPL